MSIMIPQWALKEITFLRVKEDNLPKSYDVGQVKNVK